MGSRISVDKHVSCLEDVLDINPKILEKVKFENNVPDCITQHIKVTIMFYGLPLPSLPLRFGNSQTINKSPVSSALNPSISVICRALISYPMSATSCS